MCNVPGESDSGFLETGVDLKTELDPVHYVLGRHVTTVASRLDSSAGSGWAKLE